MADILVEKKGNEAGTTASKFKACAEIRYTDSNVTQGYYIQVRRYLLYYPPSGYDGSQGFQGTIFECNWGDDFKVYGYDKEPDGIYGDTGWVNVGWKKPNESYSITATCGYTGSQKHESTVTASYTVPNVKTLTYHANGGDNAPESQTDWANNAIIITTSKPKRTGYDFKGWSTSSLSEVAEYNAGDSYTNTSSDTLYAVWEKSTYTVKYDANGGSGAPKQQVKVHGEDLTLTDEKPVKTDYTFMGWATTKEKADAGTVTHESGGTYTYDYGSTLYAVWKLSYINPEIINNTLTLTRCDESGNDSVVGRYIKIDFDWKTDEALTLDSVNISVIPLSSLEGENVYGSISAIASSSGKISEIIGGEISPIVRYEVKVKIKDTAGLETIVSDVLEKEIYVAPTIGNIVAIRAGEDGNENDDGECGLIKFNWSIDPMGGSNSASNISISYREHGGYEYLNYIEVEYPLGVDSFTSSVFIDGNVLDSGKSYDFMIVVEDKVSSTVKYTMITYSFCTMDFRAGGRGIALGKHSGEDIFDVNMPTRFRRNVDIKNDDGDAPVDVIINGRKYGENQILWSSEEDAPKFMGEGSGVALKQKVSEQVNGIVLVFSYFNNEDDVAENASFSCHFVPKSMVGENGLNKGGSHTFIMSTFTSKIDVFGVKHLYISDERIDGYTRNSMTETSACGIKYSNNSYALRYVIGV